MKTLFETTTYLLLLLCTGLAGLRLVEFGLERDATFKTLEEVKATSDLLTEEVKASTEYGCILSQVIRSQQKHMDGQRVVIDRLSELQIESREQLKNAHAVNLAKQSNVSNLESIVEEAAKRICELQKEVSDLQDKCNPRVE